MVKPHFRLAPKVRGETGMGHLVWSALKRQANTVASLLGALVVWEIAVRVARAPEYILPAPS